MFTRIAIQDVGGCPVVAVTVSTGTRRPYYLTDKGLAPLRRLFAAGGQLCTGLGRMRSGG